MVAYNFAPRFAPLIADGLKRQTIRAYRRGRARHALRGDALQLYTGMRTTACELVARAVCTEQLPIAMEVSGTGIASIEIGGRRYPPQHYREFALADGFTGFPDMGAFWLYMHGRGRFEGVLIRWDDVRRA